MSSQEGPRSVEQEEKESWLEEPRSGTEAVTLVSNIRSYVAGKYFAWLAEHKTDKAKVKFSGRYDSDKPGDEFKRLREDATYPGRFNSNVGDWEQYQRYAEGKRMAIRREVVEGYLALKRARVEATTEADQQRLKELFQRQTELMHLMHSPEYTQHLETLSKHIKGNIEYLQRELGKTANPQITREISEWSSTQGLDIGALRLLAEIDAKMKGQSLGAELKRNNALLESLEMFRGEQEEKAA